MQTEQRDVIRRATAAWLRDGGAPGDIRGYARTRDGKTHVALYREGHALAIYRVRNDGKLKRLRRPPLDLAVPDYERPMPEQLADAAADRIEALNKRIRQLEHELAYANARLKAAEAKIAELKPDPASLRNALIDTVT